jgi:hypothetical protein
VGIDRPDIDRGPERAELAGPRGSHGADVPFIPNGPSRLPLDRSDHQGMPDRAAYHAEYKATVDAVYRADAISRGYDRVRETEEKTVTPAMRRIEAEDPDRSLVGLDFRLKGKDRIEEKVTKAMAEQPDLTYADAFATVKDAIRYTFQYPEERYATGVHADLSRLEATGFERVDCRNTWTNEEYKGINSRWQVPDSGQRFEVQFHTQASFEAKQETHAAYEKLRSPATPKDEQDKLVEFQRDVTARVPIPLGAADIPDYP